ncbi:hypothetical protein J2Y38_001157 [Flavobacterium sp. 2755]|uniref:hypothetical protein n=1 Tax=Flavobacterium sp. 2755 TaxID=2817765 RepID=UPI0028639CE0|nr:hypothetical protein [Flavobacterium sp. 2755]MDR6760959.1 hypothetical protein [Flavobacterium sp. 2755]
MKIDDLNLDYYSDFLGEKEIRFYTNSKNIPFQRNIQKNSDGTSTEYLLKQGENGIYFFSLWEGYFYSLISELNVIPISPDLPEFITNWIKSIGWSSEDVPDIISENEIDWLIEKTVLVNEKVFENSTDLVWDFKCITDLIIFLKFVKENDMELRISLE